MRTSLAVAITSVVLLVGWFCHDLNVRAQGGGGSGCGACVQEICGDVNGDQAFDISDPIFLLSNLFLGGPPPCALANGCDVCLTPEQAMLLDELGEMAFGLKIAATYRLEDSNDIRGLVTISADGTFQYDTEDQFGHRAPGYRFASSWRGTWERMEGNQIRGRGTRMFFVEDGAPLFMGELYSEMTFTDDYKVATGPWTYTPCDWSSWAPGNCTIIETGEGSVTITRIR